MLYIIFIICIFILHIGAHSFYIILYLAFFFFLPDIMLQAFSYIINIFLTCNPYWLYIILLNERSLFYLTRFLVPSSLPLCVQKEIFTDLCHPPLNRILGFYAH